jgi:hypothetical protein
VVILFLSSANDAVMKKQFLMDSFCNGNPSQGATSQALKSIRIDNSEMVKRIKGFDWSHTLVGPLEYWPQSLQDRVTFLLANRFPSVLFCSDPTGIWTYSSKKITLEAFKAVLSDSLFFQRQNWNFIYYEQL